MNTLQRTGIALAVTCIVAGAQAGRTCEARAPDAAAVVRSLDLAVRTANRLEATGAQVVMLARNGQDLGRYGLRWSHLGWAYRDELPGARLVWRVVHKLNQCGSDSAAVFRQGLAEFLLDDLFEEVVGVVVLHPSVQADMLPLLKDNARVAQLHTAAYSMVAYPWAQTYQQSNQWAIETLASAEDPRADSRERAQAWLRLRGYQPTTLRLGPLTRLGARMSSAHIAFDDHPDAKRFSDRIETVSADSVITWLERSGLGGSLQVWR